MNSLAVSSRRDEGPSTIVEIESDSDLRQTENEGLSQPSRSTDSSMDGLPVTFECRICLQSEKVSKLIRPCACDGTLLYCHFSCLKTWVKESRKLKCEICGQSYKGQIKDRLAITVARAERRDQERRDALLGTQLAELAAGDNPSNHRSPQCRFTLMFFFLIALIYISLRIRKSDAIPSWVENCLEIITFVVPVYYLGRLFVAVQRYREDQESNV